MYQKQTTMKKQETFWMPYLIIGVTFCFVFLFSSCGEETIEYKLDADIIYKNETDHLIKYFEYISDSNQKVLLFELSPNSEKKVEIRVSGGNENQTINNCCQGILGDYQGDNAILIEYNNNDKCIIYTNEQGSATGNISAFESSTISERYYEFIYTFSEEEYNQAENCN